MAKVGSLLSKARWISTQPGVKLIATAFLLSVLHTGLIGQDCTTPDDVLYPYPYLDPPEEVTEMSEPIVINIYLHLVRDDEGEGGVSQPQIEQVKESLSENFEPIGFFFNYCLVEFNCEECYDGWFELAAYFPTQSLDDGINVYLFPTSTTVTVRAESIPSKNAAVRYAGPNSIYAHEVGHCLGLHHTFANSLCPSGLPEEYAWYYDNAELVYGDECDERGDYVCDTPPDPRLCIALTTCSTFENPGDLEDPFGRVYIDPDNVLRKNIMSRYACADQIFTSGQEMRMREMLAMAEELIGIISPFSREERISGSVVWDEPRHFDHDVVIETGADLTIETSVYFTPGHGILMEEHSTLSLDGALLSMSFEHPFCTESNGSFWKGIGMILDPNEIPPSLQITNSTIEHADKAIYNIGKGKVWVVAEESEFLNNKISVYLTNASSGIAWFTLCSFIVDEAYKGSSYFAQMVGIHSTNLYVLGCTFDFQLDEPAALTRQAIQVHNGALWVAKWSTTPTKFTNWSEAAFVSGNSGSKLAVFQHAEFYGNRIGIRGHRYWRLFSSLNLFEMSNKGISTEAFGVSLSECRSARTIANSFLSEESEIHSTGIQHGETFGEPLVLLANEFEDLNIGVYAPNSGSGAQGTMFLCNTHSGNRDFDFLVERGGAGQHGTPDKPAGNKFSQTGSSSESDFKLVDVFNFIRYYWDIDKVEEEPLDYSTNLIVEGYDEESGCATPIGLEPTEEISLGAFETVQAIIQSSLDDLYEDREELIDDGDTPTLISNIQTYSASFPSMVAAELAGIGPWVSIEAMLVFLDHVQYYSEAQVASVLAASPYVLSESSIYEFVYGSSSTLSSTARDYITSAAEAGDAGSDLQAEIAYEELRLAYNMDEAVAFVLLQDSLDYELLRSTLAWREDLRTEIAITETFLDEGDYETALDHIDGIGSRITLSVEEEGDIDDYFMLTSMLINVYSDNRIEDALTSEELDTLIYIVENGGGFARSKSCAILAFFHAFDCDAEVEEHVQYFHPPLPASSEEHPVEMELWPNPSSGDVLVTFSQQFGSGKLQLLRIDGRIIAEIPVDCLATPVVVNLAEYTSGMYILKYIDDSVVHVSKKIIKL